jgi:hypothetical protein
MRDVNIIDYLPVELKKIALCFVALQQYEGTIEEKK